MISDFCSLSGNQIDNLTEHLGNLGLEISHQNVELEQQIRAQNSIIGDIRQMLRNLTKKQG